MTKTNYEDLVKAFGGDGSVKIAVVGIGGGGNNSISYMAQKPITGVDFFAANTDIQSLSRITVGTIPLGCKTTKGLGTGGDPNKGKEAAIESSDIIQTTFAPYDIVFLTAGLGGGTGSGGIGVFAEILKSLGKLTIAIVTTPFKFEGGLRTKIANLVIDNLIKTLDSLIVVPNDKLLTFLDKDTPLIEAFSICNEVLDNAVRGITTLVTEPGLINVDCADVFAIIKDMGHGVMSSGSGFGELRAKTAIIAALNSPLLSDTDISTAKGILINVTSGLNLKLSEFQLIGDTLTEYMDESTKVVMGTSIDPDADDELKITLIITGTTDNKKKHASYSPEQHEKLFHSKDSKKDSIDKITSFLNKDKK